MSAIQSMMNVGFEVLHTMRFELMFTTVFLASWAFTRMLRARSHLGCLEAKAAAKQEKIVDDVVEEDMGRKQPRKQTRAQTAKDAVHTTSATRRRRELQQKVDKENLIPQQHMGAGEGTQALLATLTGNHNKLLGAIVSACNHRYGQAMELYKEAVPTGVLDLSQVSASQQEQLFSNLILASIRVGKPDAMLAVVRDMVAKKVQVETELVASITKMCTSKHFFAQCLEANEILRNAGVVVRDQVVWSCMIYCAAETPDYEACMMAFEQLKLCGKPSTKDYGNVVRMAATRGDWARAVKLMREMVELGIEPDSVVYNTALASCVAAKQLDKAEEILDEMEKMDNVTDVITYNTVMKGYARAGLMNKCFELREKMISKGITASQVTFGILLDACVNDNEMDKATKVFEHMVENKCPMNTVLYTTLVKGFARGNNVNKAMEIYESMKTNAEVSPDLVTFSILIKANCDAGRLEDAIKLLQDMMQRGYRPDEIVYNNLLTGCVRKPNVALGRHLLNDMVESGVTPSNATFSIMIKLFAKAQLVDEAWELLESMRSKYDVEPEPRLFIQLVQACIRERHGKRAVEIYKTFAARSSPPSEVANGNILSACVTFNMFDTAMQLLDLIVEGNGGISAKDANALLDATIKKKKESFANMIADLMKRRDLRVEPRLVPLLHMVSSGGG